MLNVLLLLALIQQPNLGPLIKERSELLGYPMDMVESSILTEAVEGEAKGKIGIPIILAIIELESRYERKAKSKRKCKGLMQISENTAKHFSVKLGITNYNPYDIKQNIKVGVSYLTHLLNLHKRLAIALTVYNQGYRNFGQVSDYALKVLSRANLIKEKLTKTNS